MDSKTFYQNLMTPNQVAETFAQCLTEKKPCNLVCLGDGEIYFIAYKQLPGFDKFPFKNNYVKYANDLQIRQQVLEGVKKADIIGTLETAGSGYGYSFFEHYQVSYDHICDGYIGRGLHFTGLLYEKILRNRRVFLLGWSTKKMLPFFDEYGIQCVGHTDVNYFDDISRIKSLLRATEFDIAILSAGIPSLIIAPWIRYELGKCAMDVGSATGYMNREINQIGSSRRDLAIYNPDAKNGFRKVPFECYRG